MTVANHHATVKYRQRRVAVAILAAAAGFLTLVLACGGILGLRINTTPSEPVGLWRIVPISPSSVRAGMTVFVCPPHNERMLEALRRGYLRRGLCPGGFGPLIKTIVAVAGQRIKVTDHLTVNGTDLVGSRIVDKDGQGRSLVPDTTGTVPPGSIYLYSAFPGSWDSRYFGPIPMSGVIGMAQEVWTYAP